MGDRTQLPALMLAAHYGNPWPILAGVLCATLANHAVVGLVVIRLCRFLTPTLLNSVVGVSMIGVALWTFIACAQHQRFYSYHHCVLHCRDR